MSPRDATNPSRLERRVLLSPDVVARAAASTVNEPEASWMLTQPRRVRRSYVEQVLDKQGDYHLLRQVWMLRQAKAVRESYIRDVLRAGSGGSAES